MMHIPRGRRQLCALAVAVGCTAFLTAACTGSAPAPATGNPQAGPVPQVAPSDAGQPSPGSQHAQPGQSASQRDGRSASPAPAPSSPQPAPPVPSCATASLRGSLGAGTGAAGTFDYPVQFTNDSGSACTLFGYPGVTAVTGPSGSQIGAAAARIPTFSPQLVTIAPGSTVHATLQLPNPGLLSPSVCVPKTVPWLRVYPPGEFTPLYISVPAAASLVQICTGSHLGKVVPLGIFVVLPGAADQ